MALPELVAEVNRTVEIYENVIGNFAQQGKLLIIGAILLLFILFRVIKLKSIE